MGFLWSINPEQIGHPYLLDWYYMSPPPHAAADNPKHSAAPSEPAHGSREDGLPPAHGSREDGLPPYETRLDVEEDYHYKLSGKRQSHFEASTSSAVFRDEGYHHKLSGRQQSHFEASTFSAVFRDSVLQYRDLDPSEGGCTERYWHARPGPQVSDLQASFPEPPSFNLPNRSLHSGGDIWDKSLEEPEEDDGSNHSRNSSTLSRTRYMVDCDSVHLPFGDINGGDNISGDTRSNQFQWKHGMDHI